ncbi:hypothetical protein [Promicromonospora sp. NPDC023805]|uniref:hypothetical protein n=1 Tax=Promicromonospora sp. NPDC023805 TaxID=3154696 RepID=UPI0033E648D3
MTAPDVTPAIRRAAQALSMVPEDGWDTFVPTATEALAAGLVVEEIAQVLEKHQLGPYMEQPDVEQWGYACTGCDEFMEPAHPGRRSSVDFALLVHQAVVLRASIVGEAQ